MKEWGNVGLKNLKNLQNIDKLSPLRSRRDKELKDLEYNAIRKSLMGNEFSNEKNRLAQRYDDQNSLERQRAKFYGEDYGRLLDKKRDKALEEVDEKRKFFMDSLDSKMQGSAKSHFEKLSFDEQEKFKKDLMNTRNEIAARYRQDMLGDKIGSLDKKNIADGLVDARLDNPLKVGDKDYNNLSLFELESMMKSLGMASIGDSAKLLQEMKDRAQKEYDKAKSKEGDGLTDSQKAIQDKQEKEAALEGEAKKFQEELQRNFDKLSAEEKDRMRSAHDEAERAISGYRSSVTSLNGDINAMARARGELQAMLGDPNLSSAQYNEIAAMINSINNEVIREKLLADYQNTKDKIDSGDFNNKELIGVLAGRIGEQVNDANYQLDQARNAAFGAIDGAHELADVSKLQESIAEFSNANSAYNKDFDKMVKEEVIVKDLKVEFGQSLADAFSIGAQDALIKGGDVSIGGQQAEVMVDGIAVANAQMTYAQHKFAVKSNKNKMAHLEYQKSSLERELNEAKRNGDDRAVNDLSHQIGSIDSDLSSVKRDNAMELSRMNEAETAISRLQGSNV